VKDLDAVVTEMYASVCFEKGERPDWSRSAAIFAPAARMVRINDSGIFEFEDQKTYQADFDRMIDSGEMPSFWEGELWRETKEFGDMAHVLSAYETRRSRNGEFMNRGANSIQMFRRDGHWWISAMIWRREGKNVRIGDGPPR
jgi:hypothetical protein